MFVIDLRISIIDCTLLFDLFEQGTVVHAISDQGVQIIIMSGQPWFAWTSAHVFLMQNEGLLPKGSCGGNDLQRNRSCQFGKNLSLYRSRSGPAMKVLSLLCRLVPV